MNAGATAAVPWALPLDAARLPLLAPRHPQAPIAWRGGAPISVACFLDDARELAQRLPGTGQVANLCVDRYAFAVAFAAALLAGRSSLLPPDARSDTLARLRDAYPGLGVLSDQASLDAAGLPRAGPRPVPDTRDPEPGASGRCAESDRDAIPMLPADRESARLLTSGSTGTPQPHAKDWRNLWSTAATGARRLAAMLGRPCLSGLTLVGTVPAQHSYGFESTVLLGLIGGAAFDCGRPFYPADIAEALAAVPRPRGLVTTPFHLKTLLRSGVPLPPADLVLSATAPLSPQLAQQAEKEFGGPLLEIYGCTEAGQVAMRRTAATDEWQAFDGLALRAVEALPGADERFVAEGGCLPGPIPLADILELRDASHFRLLGRANDLVHVAGKRSSLGHLDFHLNSIPGVEDGAFWLPDEVADGVVRSVAFVVAPALDAPAIVAALRERLDPAFVPRKVVHLPSLPREATGKLTRRTLRAMADAAFGGASTAQRPAGATAHAAAPAPAATPPSVATGPEETVPVAVPLRIPIDHPAFAGHFPGQPLLPGALLLAEVLEALRGQPALADRLGDRPVLAAAKFLAPVRPGAPLSVELAPEAPPSRGLRFVVRLEDGATAASGRWMPETAASGEAPRVPIRPPASAADGVLP